MCWSSTIGTYNQYHQSHATVHRGLPQQQDYFEQDKWTYSEVLHHIFIPQNANHSSVIITCFKTGMVFIKLLVYWVDLLKHLLLQKCPAQGKKFILRICNNPSNTFKCDSKQNFNGYMNFLILTRFALSTKFVMVSCWHSPDMFSLCFLTHTLLIPN